jgi:TonB family protein
VRTKEIFIAGLFVAALSTLSAQDRPGKIIIYRESHFTENDYVPPVFCDGVQLGMITGGTYLEIAVPAGHHTCAAESLQLPAFAINVTPEEIVYFRVKIKSGFKRHASLVSATDEDFTKVAKLTRAAAPIELNRQPQSAPSARISEGFSGVPGSTAPEPRPPKPLVPESGYEYPKCIYCPDPKYTEAARKARFQGTVRLQIVIDQNGSTGDVQLVQGSGHADIDQKAIETVKTWKFKPATGTDGKALTTTTTVEMNFRLLN